MKPERGLSALCASGIRGLIIGKKRGTWYGVCLYNPGKKWQSRRPYRIKPVTITVREF